MKVLGFSVFIFFLLTGCQSSQSSSLVEPVIETITVATFAEGIENLDSVQLVDVRTPSEYNRGTIEGSHHINFYQEDFIWQLGIQLKKYKPVYVFCHSGKRSGEAAILMKELGFKKIYNLEGGLMAWNNKPL